MLDKAKTDLHFRFLQLDKLQALTLAREVLGASYHQVADTHSFVGYVPLTESHLDDIHHFFIRQKMHETHCDIFVAVVSELQKGCISLPPIVNRMLKDINCPLTFSFELETHC